MYNVLSGKTTQQIEKEAKLIVLDADADAETLLSYQTINQTRYQDAVEAYKNQETLEAFYLFTQYLHLTAQVSRMLQLEGNYNDSMNRRFTENYI